MSIHALIAKTREGQRAFDELERRGHIMRCGDPGVLLVSKSDRLRERDRETIREYKLQFLDICEYRETFGGRPRLV